MDLNFENKAKSELDRITLKAQKVELGIVDDLQRSFNSLAADSNMMTDSYGETSKLYNEVQGASKRIKSRIDTNKQIFKSSKSKLELAEKALVKAENAAKELGLNTKDIKNYADVERGVKIVQDDIKALEKVTKLLEKEL